MKNVIGLFIILFGCHNSNDTMNNDIQIKSEKLHQLLVKRGINSYFKNDTLYVRDKNNSKVLETNLHLNLGSIRMDTFYLLSQTQNDKYLSISIGGQSEVVASFSGLIDLKTNRWLVFQKDSLIVASEYYISSSEDDNLHLFEGFANGFGSFAIYNSNNKLLKTRNFYICKDDTLQLKWTNGNKLYYYSDLNKKDTVVKNMPKIEADKIYAQKYYWINGKDSITCDYKICECPLCGQ